MEAFILAGGIGSRLRPFTVTIPKPLLPIGDRSILDILLQQLANCGFRRTIVSIGYLAPLFRAFLSDGSKWNLDIEFVEETTPLGTAGALRLASNLPDHFIVVNGDTLTDLDYGEFLQQHVASGAIASIFVHEANELVNYGVLEFDARTRRLKRYIEKPTHVYQVSTGIYAVSRAMLGFLPAEGRYDMPDLIRAAVSADKDVRCIRTHAYWKDIGRMDHYEDATSDFLADSDRFLLRSPVTPHEG